MPLPRREAVILGLEGFLEATMSDEDMIVHAGPFQLPNGGRTGKLSWTDRQEIKEMTGVSAAVRDRKNTNGVRFLTMSGPVSGMSLAKTMAWAAIKHSQEMGEEFEQTPGEEPWRTTVRQDNFSEMPPTMQRPVQPMMHPMMQIPQMMNPMMQQPHVYPMMHLMMQPQMHSMMHPAMMQPQDMQSQPQRNPRRVPKAREDEPEDVSSEDTSESEEEQEQGKGEQKQSKQKFAGLKVSGATSKAAAKPKYTQPKKVDIAKLATKADTKHGKENPAKKGKDKAAASSSCAAAAVADDTDDATCSEFNLKVDEQPTSKRVKLLSPTEVSHKECSITIYSVGWRQQGTTWSRDFNELMYGKQGLVSRLKVRGIGRPNMVLDCRPMNERYMPHHILQHTGYHGDIVSKLAGHRFFTKGLMMVMKELKGCMDNGDVSMMLVCTSGVHRSVAAALIFEYVFKSLGYKVHGLRHLSKGSWGPRDLCQGCKRCRDDDPIKLQAFQDVLEVVS